MAPGIFLKGITPLGTITRKNFNLAGPTRGQSLVIFATGMGAVTQSGRLSPTSAPFVRAAMPAGLGISPTSKVECRPGNSVLVALQQWEY
jgi:hypothetical protein